MTHASLVNLFKHVSRPSKGPLSIIRTVIISMMDGTAVQCSSARRSFSVSVSG